jgi:hypothetical protein
MPEKTPPTGTCYKCSQPRPLFEFEIVVAQPWAFTANTVWLCAPDWSQAAELDEDDRNIWDWLPERSDDWSPWRTAVTAEAVSVDA